MRAGSSGFGANMIVGRDTRSETFVPRSLTIRRFSTSREIIICANLKKWRYARDIVGYKSLNTYMLLSRDTANVSISTHSGGVKHP